MTAPPLTPGDLRKPRAGDRCLVCGGPPELIGIFIPDHPGLYGATKGKMRFIRYCLCAKCHGRPDTPDRIEKILKAEIAAGVTYEY